MSQSSGSGRPKHSSRKAPRLGRRALFFLTCRELTRAGPLSKDAKALLLRLQKFLRLPAPQAREISELAAASGQESSKPPRPFEPLNLYHLAHCAALRSGPLSTREAELLAGLGHILEVPRETLEETLGALLQEITGDIPVDDGEEVILTSFDFSPSEREKLSRAISDKIPALKEPPGDPSEDAISRPQSTPAPEEVAPELTRSDLRRALARTDPKARIRPVDEAMPPARLPPGTLGLILGCGTLILGLLWMGGVF